MPTSQLTREIVSLPLNIQKGVKEIIADPEIKSQTQQHPPLQKRQFGAGKGFFTMSEDFDEPLEDFKEYM